MQRPIEGEQLSDTTQYHTQNDYDHWILYTNCIGDWRIMESEGDRVCPKILGGGRIGHFNSFHCIIIIIIIVIIIINHLLLLLLLLLLFFIDTKTEI